MATSTALVLDQLGILAPLRLAESWDNVGLIVDPGERAELHHAFLTIDLTDETLAEALALGADLIIAYHPPIFSGLRRLRADRPGERLVLRAIRAGMLVYSPHTALDAAAGGMAEWLGGCLGQGSSRPIVPDAEEPHLGGGRLVALAEEVSLPDAISAIKRALGLNHVRLSAPRPDLMVRRLAVCPGAGGSLFERVLDADLLLTGEMRHHDVLARRAAGTAVVLTDHTNTERAYLPIFAQRLIEGLPGLRITVSSRDADPLSVV